MTVVVGMTSASAATVDVNAWYVLVNRNSGKALDVFNFSTADGGRITQWTRSNANNQQWQFVDSGGGLYRIRSRHSGKVVDVLNRSTADGATVAQWADGNGTNQQWRLADSAGGFVRFINRNSGKALDVQNASTADGANIVQFADSGGQQPAMATRPRDQRQPSPSASPSTSQFGFTSLGSAFTFNNAWQFFMGYRYGIFNYATRALGGAVTIKRFEMSTP